MTRQCQCRHRKNEVVCKRV
ncbi:hypothetical protein [Aestuariibaculum sp. M13]